VIEGQMGRAFADDPNNPTAYRITTGPFWYFAGNPNHPGARSMMLELTPGNILMPSARGWVSTAQVLFPDRLLDYPRYSFSPDQLSEAHLNRLLEQCPRRVSIVSLDTARTEKLGVVPIGSLEIQDFDSPADFLARGFGFAAMNERSVIGAAYSCLVCSRGIEVSIYVEKHWRERGVGTALAARLLLECLQCGLRPNWDAANTESYRLAKNLGLTFTGEYPAYFLS
jgi:GNAT superfamily N-acetyltransferase